MTGKTRDEVRAKYLALHQAARRGPVVSSVPTLASYLDGWLTEVVRPSLAPQTAANYEVLCRLYIAPVLGSKRLDTGGSLRGRTSWRLADRSSRCSRGLDT